MQCFVFNTKHSYFPVVSSLIRWFFMRALFNFYTSVCAFTCPSIIDFPTQSAVIQTIPFTTEFQSFYKYWDLVRYQTPGEWSINTGGGGVFCLWGASVIAHKAQSDPHRHLGQSMAGLWWHKHSAPSSTMESQLTYVTCEFSFHVELHIPILETTFGLCSL